MACDSSHKHLAQLSVYGAVRVNETDTFADEDGANDEYFDFEDVRPSPLPACYVMHLCKTLI